MDSFIYLSAFVRAVEARNFTEAVQQLGMCASAIGRALARRDKRHGMRFFRHDSKSSVFPHVVVLFRPFLRLSRRVDASISTFWTAARGHGK
jgi:DNA-binding transcriptional LysR family regulator